MSPAPEIKGWCPGAYAPMASGDGLLIRAKIVGSRIGAAQLQALAEISAACGNGLVDLSQRAQLQLRGVSPESLEDALSRLDQQGLLAPNADAERVTNIVAAPLAGLDAQARFDANALARELARALQADAALGALPAKFFVAIDDGSALSLADAAADLRIEPFDATRVAIFVSGADGRAVIADMRVAVPTTLRLAHAFVALRADHAFELRRMRRLVTALGLDALLRAAECESQAHAPRGPSSIDAVFGAHRMQGGAYAGVAAPFGRWRAEDLARLAELALRDGIGDIRLTPWRAFLIPTETRDAAQRIVEATGARGLIVSASDPRRAVVACPGAPECPQALGETRSHLARLAPLAQKLAGAEGVGLHISGCAKGCARPQASAATLLAHDGLFDLIDNGRASDAPRLTGLTIEAVEDALQARARERATCPTP